MLEELHPDARRHLRRNFALGVVNGVAFALSDALQDPTLVLSVFIARLTSSPVLVGLLVPVRMGGWFLPQLLLSGRVQAAPAKLPYYRAAAIARISANFALALAAFVLPGDGLLLALAFLFMSANTLSGGLSGLAFTDVVGKTIPSRMRGRWMAWRMSIGGVLVLAASLVVAYVLDDARGIPFPRDYAILFFLSSVALAISLGSFAFVREPRDGNTRPRASVPEQLRRAVTLPRRNVAYRSFIIARVSLMLAEIAGPFYILYAKLAFGLPDAIAGSYLMIATVANILSTYMWGRVSDGVGNRAVMRLVALFGVLVPALTLGAVPAFRGLGAPDWFALGYFGLVFALLGVTRTGTYIGGTNFLLDAVPADDRPIYIGLTNTLTGVASLLTALGGVVVEVAGYGALFFIAFLLYLASGVVMWRSSEPREQQMAEQVKHASAEM